MKSSFVCAFGLCSLISCGSGNSSSAPQYGVLSKEFRSLLELPPGSRVLVCGTNDYGIRDTAVQALRRWGNISGRYNLNVFFGSYCGNRNTYSASITVYYGGASCGSGTVAAHSQNGQHHEITLCNASLGARNQYPAMLHEMGHAFGMCDQYDPNDPGKIAFHGNCMAGPRSLSAQWSVMGGSYDGAPTDLTTDDIVGVRILACMSYFSANAAWAKGNESEYTTWNSSSFNSEKYRLQNLGWNLVSACR